VRIQVLINLIITLSIVLSCAPRMDSISINSKNHIDTVDAQSYPDAGAVILLDEANVILDKTQSGLSSEIERRTSIRILNERGYPLANISIPYGEHTHISNTWARTISPDGQIIELDKNQIFDINLYPDYIFYSDIRVKRFTLPGIEPGCTIEYGWRENIHRFSFWASWPFQHQEPCLKSRYQIQHPEDMILFWSVNGSDLQPKTMVGPRGKVHIKKWELQDIPAFIPESSMPPGNEERIVLSIAPVGLNRWEDVSTWFYRLADQRMQPDEAIKNHVVRITEPLYSQREKLRGLYEFVRDHIRYVAIEIGIGDYQPHFAATTFRNRYGDCKDKVALLSAMAQCLSIPVYPVLISTWHHGRIDTSLVSHTHFNHVIAVAHLPDGDWLWMDPTDRTCPFEELPWYDQNRKALIINPNERATLTLSPGSWPIQNRITRNWYLNLHEDGSVDGELKMLVYGAQASAIRNEMQDVHPNDLLSELARQLVVELPISRIRSINASEFQDAEVPLFIEASVLIDHLSRRVDNKLLLQPGQLSAHTLHHYFTSESRQYSVLLKHPLRIEDRVYLQYSPEWKTDTVVRGDTLDCQFGKYWWNLESVEKGKINYLRTFDLTETSIPPEAYHRFREFLFTVAQDDQMLFTLDIPKD